MRKPEFAIIDIEELLQERSKGARTRLRIADRAIDLIADKGIEEFSFERLAQECKLARSAIYRHFTDMAGLFTFLSHYIRRSYQLVVIEAMKGQTSASAILKAYVTSAIAAPAQLPKETVIWMLFFHQCARQGYFAEQNRRLVEQGTARIAAILEGGIISREFKLQKDQVPAISRAIQLLVTGGVMSRATEKRSPQEWERDLELIWDQCLRMVS